MIEAQPDLIGALDKTSSRAVAAVPGLSLAQDFIDQQAERGLIARIDATGLSPFQYQQWQGKRLTSSFGWSYDFTARRVKVAPDFPEWLLNVRDRAANFAGLKPAHLVQALLIRYDPGAGIGWHRDRPVFEHVIGISLGNPATMRFRRRRADGFDRAKAELPPRSIYHLTGEVRHEWEHSIAPMDVPRWSITFRSLAGVRR